MAGGIYETCLALVGPGDLDGLLQCATNQIEAAHDTTVSNMSDYLLIINGALVFFMQAGFAMVCAGSVRKKNTQNTMLKNILDACGAAIAYFCVGFGLAFGGDATATKTTFVGTENFFARGDFSLPFYFFQYTFSAAAVTIVAGALAERCQMAAYLFYSFFLTGFIYPVTCHSIWSPAGFLSSGNPDPLLNIGMVDFAGSAVVHMTGGTTALISTYLLGSRRGRFYDLHTGEALEVPKPMPGHSVSLQMLGTFILWFGWFGFNPGSALLLSNSNPYRPNICALCAVNTFLSSASSCISALVYKLILTKSKTGEAQFDLLTAMNGTLSGLVAITAGCATVPPWASILIGAIAGILYLWSSNLLILVKLDDVVDAIPVHFVNGLWGVLAVGLLSEPELMRQAIGKDEYPGFFYSLGRGQPSGNLLACQTLGALFVFGWTIVSMTPFFLILNYYGLLRSEAVEELVGLDVCYNGDQVYDKEGSDGDDAQLRGEFLEAYEDYRVSRSKHGQKKVAIPPEKGANDNAEEIHESSASSYREYAPVKKASNHGKSLKNYDDTTSV